MRVIVAAFLLVVVLLPGAGRAEGPSFQDGLAAYEGRDFQRALAIWLPLAEAGDAEARYRVGRLHGEGEGVPKDEAVAAAWYRKAADQGHAPGQVALGECLWHGRGVVTSLHEAHDWFKAAAKQGNAWGQYGLGLWLAYPRDGGYPLASLAAHWFEKAAAQGLAEAQYEMGERYRRSDGMRRDSVKAIEWYRKAADQGMPQAYSAIGLVYAYGFDPRVPKDSAKEFEWYLEAAERGRWTSQVSVAQFLLEGKVVPGDAVEGLKWAIIANRSGRTSESVLKALEQIRMTKEARAEARRRAEAWKPRGSWRKPLVSRPGRTWD